MESDVKKYSTPKFKRIIDLVHRCLNMDGQCGFHIAIDDGNLEDANVLWCYDYARGLLDAKYAKEATANGTKLIVRRQLTAEGLALNEALYHALINLTERERHAVCHRACERNWRKSK